MSTAPRENAAESAEPSISAGKILVVDDEPSIVNAVSYNLRRQNFSVVTACDADEALRVFSDEQPDLVILDVMLPSGSGFDICRAMREQSRVPILMLTARIAESDRVRGLDTGADDYVVKPFGMRELVARVRALLRRAEPMTVATPEETRGLYIDHEKREAHFEGKLLALSRREFDLLVLLASSPGRVFDRQTILDRVWGEDACVDNRTVDVHIRWLREKIERTPARPEYLLTVRGFGYKLKG